MEIDIRPLSKLNQEKAHVRNLDFIPRGKGFPYLEVMITHIPNEFVAVQWKRVIPQKLNAGHFLIDCTR